MAASKEGVGLPESTGDTLSVLICIEHKDDVHQEKSNLTKQSTTHLKGTGPKGTLFFFF